MESYILLTYLNDFIFCPRSIYYHNVYSQFNAMLYYKKAQYQGQAAHKSIDSHTYSTRKNILQGTEVYCEEHNLAGKIDIFDIDKKLLRERKKKIVKIYDGYVFQVYGQCFALREMGYTVEHIELYSIDDNKTYTIPLPENNIDMQEKFFALLKDIRSFDISAPCNVNKNKCIACIYNTLCDKSEV